MTLLLPSRPDSRRSRCPPLPFRQSLSRIGLLFLHLSRHAVPPRSDSADRAAPTDSCFLIPPTPFVGTARRSRRSLANVLPLTITLLCMPFICTALLTFIERALLAAEACPRCHCRAVPVIHTHTLANTPPPCT